MSKDEKKLKLDVEDKTKDKVIIKFKMPLGRYSTNDVAGFTSVQAKELVEAKKVAEYYKK